MPQENDISDLLKFTAGILSLAAVFVSVVFFGYLIIKGEAENELRFLAAKICEFLKFIETGIGH